MVEKNKSSCSRTAAFVFKFKLNNVIQLPGAIFRSGRHLKFQQYKLQVEFPQEAKHELQYLRLNLRIDHIPIDR